MLNQNEKQRLIEALEFCYAIPLIDDVEDYIWESVWSYVKNIPIENNLSRNKKLFDVVDEGKSTGWSAKTILWNLNKNRECEFVIGRADVFKKNLELGFSELNENSDPQDIGNAVCRHWINKINKDSDEQGIQDKRIVMLLKDMKQSRFLLFEDKMHVPSEEDLVWQWTNQDRVGLQGRNKVSGAISYRWYKNQKQLFERIIIPENVEQFEINISKLELQAILKIFKDFF